MRAHQVSLCDWLCLSDAEGALAQFYWLILGE